MLSNKAMRRVRLGAIRGRIEAIEASANRASVTIGEALGRYANARGAGDAADALAECLDNEEQRQEAQSLAFRAWDEARELNAALWALLAANGITY
jgi:hypothetical protein